MQGIKALLRLEGSISPRQNDARDLPAGWDRCSAREQGTGKLQYLNTQAQFAELQSELGIAASLYLRKEQGLERMEEPSLIPSNGSPCGTEIRSGAISITPDTGLTRIL